MEEDRDLRLVTTRTVTEEWAIEEASVRGNATTLWTDDE